MSSSGHRLPASAPCRLCCAALSEPCSRCLLPGISPGVSLFCRCFDDSAPPESLIFLRRPGNVDLSVLRRRFAFMLLWPFASGFVSSAPTVLSSDSSPVCSSAPTAYLPGSTACHLADLTLSVIDVAAPIPLRYYCEYCAAFVLRPAGAAFLPTRQDERHHGIRSMRICILHK